MKTTIEIPDALHRQAKLYAVKEGLALRDVIVAALRQSLKHLESGAFVAAQAKANFHSATDEEGWPVLRRGGGEVVTDVFLRQLREQEGV